jgi:amidase
MPDLRSLDATGMLRAMDTGGITALELLEASIVSAHRLKASLNAVVAESLEGARAAARALDARRAVGETSETLGLLAGVPMTVTDSLDVDGLAASSGLKSYLGRPAGDAAAVGRARSEGAVIWGKSNVAVLARDFQTSNDLYGRSNNPWDVDRTPGGACGGAAAALAAGVTPLEIGSDLCGSMRIPAHFCGVLCHKPTFGLVPQRGHVPPEPGAAAEQDLRVVGPMARSARDLRLLLSVLAQGPVAARAPPAQLQGLKIGLWLEDPDFLLDAEVRTVIEAFAGDLVQEGAVVETVPSPVPGAALLQVFQDLLYPLLPLDQTPAGRRGLALAEGPVRWFGGSSAFARAVRSATLSHRDWLRANEARAQFGETMKAFFKRHEVLIAPVAPVTAFAHVAGPLRRRTLLCSDGRKIPYEAMLQWVALASACHLPATVSPVGRSPSGLPVGVQIMGPRGADGKTLAVAQAFEERFGGIRAPPLDWRDAQTAS